MTTEAGDNKLLANFRKLIDLVTGEPNYKPSNLKLQVATLETQYTGGRAAVDGVAAANVPNKQAINVREIAFDEVRPLSTQIQKALLASGASKQEIDDGKTYNRKLQGARKSPKIVDDPKTPENEALKSHSASQLSYDNQLGNLRSYVEFVSKVASYNPNELNLKVTALQARVADLQARNDAVSSTFVPLSQARGLRDALLYLNDDCVVNVALLAKAYVDSALGRNSSLSKQVRGLKFARKRA